VNPGFVSTEIWRQIGLGNRYLAGFAFMLVIAGISLAGARVVIPSLLATGQLPRHGTYIKPVLYGFAAVCLGAAAVGAILGMQNIIAAVSNLFPRWAI
jgi:hypothetical protein